jgi:pimeloyl-ACP methyl ester carboxylesterase
MRTNNMTIAEHPTHTRRTITLGSGLEVTIRERGDAAEAKGTAALVLHGGAGPRTITGLAVALAEHGYVITPTHPGFNGTPRPEWADTIGDLAEAYLDLIDELDLHEVVVFGNSVGGWIAAEMATRDTRGRLAGLVLINALGIEPDDPQQITDVRRVPPSEIGQLAFYNPAFRPDPSAMSDEQRAMTIANQQTLAAYAGEHFTYDPKLRRRLGRVTVPALVIWGERDGIATSEYGRAYAASFPKGQFRAIPGAGHFPQVEQPGPTMAAIGEFAQTTLAK